MKRLFTFLLLSVFFVSATAQEEAEADKGKPRIKFETTSHDFGTITEGTQATYKFEFKNTGDAPLVLKNVRPSCGCTTPHWPRKPIMPGDKSQIKAVYNSSGRPGRFHKSITVTTNVPDRSTHVLYIKGKVVKEEKQESPVRKKAK